MSFVLRWFVRDQADNYDDGRWWTQDQKDAKRYETRAQAYQARDASVYFGAGGKDDTIGWKVVRLVRRGQ